MINVENISELSREELLQLTEIYAKNWLAHDGSWFLSIEDKFDMDTAIEMDRESWKRFTVVEANRIIQFLGLEKNSGLNGLQRALAFRLYASINKDCMVLQDENTLIYKVKSCRVQYARKKKGLEYFPCKSVGIIEYGLFAKTIDKRIETKAISCHPDVFDAEYDCIWKFTLK